MSGVANKVTTFVGANKKPLLIGLAVVVLLGVGYWYMNKDNHSALSLGYPMGGGGGMRPGMHGPPEGFYANPQGGQGGQMPQMPQHVQGNQRHEGSQGQQGQQGQQAHQGGEEPKKLVLFYAPWCPHCKDLLQPTDKNNGKPAWSMLKQKLGGRKDITMDEIDCDAKPELASKYEVKGFPTVILFKGNQKVDYDGDRSMESLEKFLETQ